MSPAETAKVLLEEAHAAGFHRAGLVRAQPLQHYAFFRGWLAAGYHGAMAHLERHAALRADPRALLPGARTILSVALAYQRSPGQAACTTFASYAQVSDYHHEIRSRLEQVASRAERRLAPLIERPLAWRACVDTAPLLERAIALAAGLGFVGKNAMLIVPGLGSRVVLGELLLDVDVDLAIGAALPIRPSPPGCGECRACLDACPTRAFAAPYTLDARRCLARVTTCAAEPVGEELRLLLGGRVFGCDTCQDACPHNARTSFVAGESAPLRPLAALADISLARLMSSSRAELRRLTLGTVLARVGRERLLRHAILAAGNVGGPAEAEELRRLAGHPSPLLREHAAWSLQRLAMKSR